MTKNNFVGVFSRSSISRFIYFILGMLLFSFSFNYFLLPNDLVFGGVSGLSIIFKNILDPSIFVFVVSSILLIISYIFLGKEKTFGSAVGSLLLPVFLKIMSFVTDNIDKVDEVFLAVIFGGLLAGVGIVYKAGFTMGGTDIINQIIHKYFKISLGKCMLISDGSIVLCSFFSFGLIKFMYAVVVLYIISTMTDKVLLGISNSKAFYIVTSQVNEVKNYVMVKLGHGITIFDAVGGFSKEDQKVLFCVIPTRDYFKLKEGIHDIDKDAFFVVTDAYEVFGGE
mgnify:CR=1 FL=1